MASFQNGRCTVIVALGSSSPPAAGLVTSAASKLSSSSEKGHLFFHLEITGIFHRSQQCVLKGSLKRNTCLWHHLPFKRVSLHSSFPCNPLPQLFNHVYKDKMVPKFIPQQAELPSFHARLCTEKRTLHKHARKLITYLGLFLPHIELCGGQQEGRKQLLASGGKKRRDKKLFALLFPLLHDLIFLVRAQRRL